MRIFEKVKRIVEKTARVVLIVIAVPAFFIGGAFKQVVYDHFITTKTCERFDNIETLKDKDIVEQCDKTVDEFRQTEPASARL